VFSVFCLCYCLVFSTGAIDCLERLISEMTCCVSNGMLSYTHSLTEHMTGHVAFKNFSMLLLTCDVNVI